MNPPKPFRLKTEQRGKIVTQRATVGNGKEFTGAGVVAPGGFRVTEPDWGERQRRWLRRKQLRKAQETDE